MERPPRLVGLRGSLRGSLVVAGFLVVPSSRDVTRDQLRVRIVPGVLLGCEKAALGQRRAASGGGRRVPGFFVTGKVG